MQDVSNYTNQIVSIGGLLTEDEVNELLKLSTSVDRTAFWDSKIGVLGRFILLHPNSPEVTTDPSILAMSRNRSALRVRFNDDWLEFKDALHKHNSLRDRLTLSTKAGVCVVCLGCLGTLSPEVLIGQSERLIAIAVFLLSVAVYLYFLLKQLSGVLDRLGRYRLAIALKDKIDAETVEEINEPWPPKGWRLVWLRVSVTIKRWVEKTLK